MNKIEMVELQGQHNQIKTQIDQAIQSVIEQCNFINGSQVGLFATELANYLNIAHVIPCANGTDALQIALMALELPPGSQIITPAFNYVATAEVIALLGYIPVFVDVDPQTFNINTTDALSQINPKTSAIMPVHLFGQCADMDAVLQMSQAHNLMVIEDAAQAIGALWGGRPAGGIGHIGTTSFFPSKNLGCMGDGGAIFSQDAMLASRLKMIANHGQAQKYEYQRVGVNSRLDTMQAAILRVKLSQLARYTHARQLAAQRYDSLLKDNLAWQIPHRTTHKDDQATTHVFHQYTLVLNPKIDRDLVRQKLQNQGIPTMVYYPKPLHLQPAFEKYGYKQGAFPVAEQLSRSVLSLPMHTELTIDQQEYIAHHLSKVINEL